MSVIYIVLPLAILLAFAAVLAFLWALRGGQFDDLDSPAIRVLFDDDPPARGRAGKSDAAAGEKPRPAEGNTTTSDNGAGPPAR